MHNAPPPVELSPPAHFAALRNLVTAAFPASRGQFICDPMPGGASARRYFRLRIPGTMETSAVAMFVPDGGAPEEVVKDSGVAARWPFLEVRDLLASRGVDVPRVYAEDTARGWIVLEDLGDDTLAAFLAARTDAFTRERLYVRAVADLARAQNALSVLPEQSVVASRAFDRDLLSWEIHHFREWALDARGFSLSPDDRTVFDEASARIASRISSWPRVFVHRDYQSRNLMVRPSGEICWIDFQDALLGPRVYDLVALLNDSYQVFDRAFVEARLDDYARASRLTSEERAALGREFDIVTVQRKLKDAGRFVFIDRVKGNASFLKYVDMTIEKARASLARLGDDEDMRAISGVLARVLPR